MILRRFAINNSSADWAMAEAQVAKLASSGTAGKSTVISVKTTAAVGQKRKAEDVSKGAAKGTEKKSGARRSMKKAKR